MSDLRDWLILQRAHLPAEHLRGWMAEHRSAPAVLRSARQSSELRAKCRQALEQPDRTAIAADLDWLAHDGHHLITLLDEDYPELLRRIDDPPPMLMAIGDPAMLWRPQMAIVGSRKASRSGLNEAKQFAQAAGRAGLMVTSGLALGIDGAAHAAALDVGAATCAVSATGLDQVYPAEHANLARRIANAGILISEQPLGAGPRAHLFPKRNRIISGLSLALVVVEADLRSGSLISARLAMEQNREVFAVPGAISNPAKRGCHQLITDGATLAVGTQMVVDTVLPLAGSLVNEYAKNATETGHSSVSTTAKYDPEYQTLLESLAFESKFPDDLIVESGLTAADVSSMLLVLELDGAIARNADGSYQCA